MRAAAPSIAAVALAAIFVAPAAASAADPEAEAPAPAARPPVVAFDQTLYESQPLPPYAPRVLSYEAGMPLPPGYRLGTRRRGSLMVAGAALFGTSYLAAYLTAATVVLGPDRHRSEVAPLFIPFAGPFVTLATSRDVQLNDVDRRTNGVLLLVDGATQLTGAVLFVVGLATREPVLERTKASYRAEEASARPEIFVGGRSAALMWRF